MDFVNQISGTLVGNRRPDAQDVSSLTVGVESTGSQSDSGPSRTNSNGAREASNVSGSLLDIFKSTLGEADSYLALYEARVKMEEDYVRGLKLASLKSRDSIVRLDARIASSMSLEPGGADLPRARQAWKEIHENHLREVDARLHYIETIRQGVIAPLTVYRDAQERIRRRVKDDLKISIAAYDEMRHNTLPRAKKTYEKRCEEAEQLRLQQAAVEEQKILLSQSSMQRHTSFGSQGPSQDDGKPISPTSPVFSEPMDDDNSRSESTADSTPSIPRRSLSTRRKSAKHLQKPSVDAGGIDIAGGRPTPSPGVSPRVGGDASLSASPPSAGGDKKGHFLDALRSRETWETARKEGPKKLNALLSRMRDGGAGDRNDGGSALSLSPDSVATGGAQNGLGVNLGGGPGSLKSNQNLALKNVKTKREAEEADKAYRKAVFDLETLRMRRHKTIQAARSSVIEARRELYLTCQAVWMQSERSIQMLTHAQTGFSMHAEDILRVACDNLDDELKKLDQRLPSVEAERIPYVNFQFGECKDLIFGVSLVDYAFSRAQQAPPHIGPPKAEAPIVVQKCIEFVEERALEQPGIYRTSAKHTAIQNLAHALERDEERFTFNATDDEPSTVAGVLKLYLRQLPEPVLPMPWEERVRYTHERQEQIQTGFASLKGRIRRLPAINQATLRTIVEHLSKIAAHAEFNKMTASNLSIIFGPLLLSQAEHDATSIAAAMEEDRVTEDLILYADDIFDLSKAGAPVLPYLPAQAEHKWDVFEGKEADGQQGDVDIPNTPIAADTLSPVTASSAQTPSSASTVTAPQFGQAQGSAAAFVASSSDTPLLANSAGIQRSNAIVSHERDGSRSSAASLQSRSATSGLQSAADAYLPRRRESDAASTAYNESIAADNESRTSHTHDAARMYATGAGEPSKALDSVAAAGPSPHNSTGGASVLTPSSQINTSGNLTPSLITPTTAVSSANASLGHDQRNI